MTFEVRKKKKLFKIKKKKRKKICMKDILEDRLETFKM